MILIRILQVMMRRAKFGRIKVRTNLLSRFDNNLGHFDNKYSYKIDKTNYEFSNEIADCCSIRLATLPQKDCKYLLKFLRKFGIRCSTVTHKVAGSNPVSQNCKVSRLNKRRNCSFLSKTHKS